ncbi:MAG: hypothetical protein AVDCRST_MAG88-1901 [uncultured Thermomicrobiales bacterium]|uniref:Uncharacterized protein n=1 Tax=uncultured Thermomicrobiales bacterium TaxID=1645740 RepID=A0A6J4V5M4_9BACT|nr:MAG: hypothetical protein AVDCRST_MAG88-1901 [uncultured Thermomicrobiales bacterium]
MQYGGAAASGDDSGDAGAGDEVDGGAAQCVFAALPRTAYAWNNFPRNMARWRFPSA